MSVITVKVDFSEWDDYIESLVDKLESPSQGLLQAVQQTVIPTLQQLSATNWRVRTGLYSGGWLAEITNPTSVTVTDAAPYSAALETGFTAGWEHNVHVAGKPTMAQSLQLSAAPLMQNFFGWVFTNTIEYALPSPNYIQGFPS